MVKLIHFALSLLSSHVKLAEVCNKSGEGKCLKKKIQFFFHKSNYGGFFSFSFLGKRGINICTLKKIIDPPIRTYPFSRDRGGTEIWIIPQYFEEHQPIIKSILDQSVQ